MERLISWRKGFFSSTYQFYSNGIQIGSLKIGTWSNSAIGILDENEFEFKTKGFFKQETIITDTKASLYIGTIIYNRWKSKAIIKMTEGSEFSWQYTNFWHSKWSLNKNLYFINYQGSNNKGEIVSYLEDPFLIIAGLFISNHYWQASASGAGT